MAPHIAAMRWVTAKSADYSSPMVATGAPPDAGGSTLVDEGLFADTAAQAATVLKFFEWAYHNGAKLATDLDYVPLPESTVKLIRASWAGMKDASGKAVFTGK